MPIASQAESSYPDVLQDHFDSYLTPHSDDMNIIAQPIDFIGVNYYFRELVLDLEHRDTLAQWNVRFTRNSDAQVTDMDWIIAPEGLSLSLAYLTNQPLPTFAVAGFANANQLLESIEASDAELSFEAIQYLENGE